MRRILLDSILVPFLLSSILLAMYAGGSKDDKKRTVLVMTSGVLLGIAIFTKLPAFLTIPLIGYLVWSSIRQNMTRTQGREIGKYLGLWLIPVILIPLIWPVQSIAAGQFDIWLRDVLWQAQRSSDGIISSFRFFFIDSLTVSLLVAGLVYAGIKRDYLILLWIIPFLLFISSGRYLNYIHWIPFLPAFFIAGAKLIDDGMLFAAKKFARERILPVLQTGIVLAITIFGLVGTTVLITTDMTSAQFAAASYVLNNYPNGEDNTIISSGSYSWLFLYVFDRENVFWDYRDLLYFPVQTSEVVLLSDPHFRSNVGLGPQLQAAYENTYPLEVFEGDIQNYDLTEYPYTYLFFNPEGSSIEIRTNNMTDIGADGKKLELR